MPAPVAAALAGSSFGKQLFQGAAQSGSSGLISGALGQLFAGMNARRQWKYTQKQMALQQRYALEQMQKQAEYEYSNWQKQFDYENDYNTPSKVFERYRTAGVTPAAVLGSSGVGVNATMSGGSAGSVGASGPSGGFSVPGVGPLDMTAVGQNMLTSSESRRNQAAAARDEAEARSIEDQNVGNQLYIAMARARVALDESIAKHNLAARDVLKVQEDIEKNNRFISDATLLSAVDEKKNQAALVAAMVKRLGIENDNLGKLMSAQAFMMNTQGALNQVLGEQAGEVIQSLRLDNLDSAYELSNNWDKQFDVEVPNPQYEKNLRSSNPVVRANPGPRSFKISMSLKDFHNKTVINQANASEFLPEQARVALRNAKLDPYVEISKALIGIAGSLGGAAIVRGGMSAAVRGFSQTSTGGTSSSSRTTVYDSNGGVKGYVIRQMTGESHDARSRHNRY